MVSMACKLLLCPLLISSRYPYPLFELLTTPYRAALFLGSAVTMTLSAFCLGYLNARFNGSVEAALAEPKSRPAKVK